MPDPSPPLDFPALFGPKFSGLRVAQTNSPVDPWRGRLHEQRFHRSEWIGSGAARMLQIEWTHLRRNLALPWLHRDPFDRLLISQAPAEGMKLVSVDSEIRKYPGVQIVG